jgi:tetratricopeptide (TPR) repeat protein
MNGARMNTLIGLTALLLLLTSLTVLTGCRESVELSELEIVLADFRNLPAEDQESALRTFAATGTPDSKYAWYELGNLYYSRSTGEVIDPGEGSLSGANALLDSALVFFGTATDMDSTFVEAIVNAGLVWDDVCDGRTPEARQAMIKATDLYNRAIALRPDDEKARCNLGSLYFRKRQYEPALEQFRAVLEVHPESALAHFNLAIMFAESKIYREAITEWELAAEYDKDGEIHERSVENIRVMRELMEAKIPENLTTKTAVQGS